VARKTIKGLEEELERYKEWLRACEERNRVLVERAEIEFANSVTKKQLEERLRLYESLNKSAEKHNESERKWRYRQSDKVKQVYEDNKAFMSVGVKRNMKSASLPVMTVSTLQGRMMNLPTRTRSCVEPWLVKTLLSAGGMGLLRLIWILLQR